MQDLDYSVLNLYRVSDHGQLLAMADVQISGTFVIRGVRILAGKGGLFVTLPQHQGKDKNWYDQIYFLDNELFIPFKNTVLAAYRSATQNLTTKG
jgi:DNA-binding cell septation regulator SpoVG